MDSEIMSGRPAGAKSLVKHSIAQRVLARVDEDQLWKELCEHPNASIRMQALQYLTDKRDGKAETTSKVDMSVNKSLTRDNVPTPKEVSESSPISEVVNNAIPAPLLAANNTTSDDTVQ